MKKTIIAIAGAIAAGCCICKCEKPVASAVSPDGRNEIRVWANPLGYEVYRDGVKLAGRAEIGMKVDGKCICARGATEPKIVKSSLSGKELTPVYKKGAIALDANETFLDYGEWGLRVAARNDGVAYRFETKMAGRIKVDCEKAPLVVPDEKAKCSVYLTTMPGCEEQTGKTMEIGEVKTTEKQMVYLPFVYTLGGKTVAVTESDVCDYPIWNLKSTEEKGEFSSTFAKWPTKTVNKDWQGSQPSERPMRIKPVVQWADWLVETEGTRVFPWRTFILADKPSKLCEADTVYALARGRAKYDFSWVKPGKVAWDWWNGWDNKGEKDGCNTATYKRFIDFASKTGVEYVILDEGWSEKLNIWKFHPNVDVPEIIRYGKEKNVGIILWMAWAQVDGMEKKVAEDFAKLGAVGFKVDFMDRGDAKVERFLWKFAEECAKNKMLVDYHGAHRPTGMSRAYPNVVNYEGIHGLEQMKFYHQQDILDNDVRCVFSRMTAGPMDYTPGAMDNYAVGTYPKEDANDPNRKTRYEPGSLGTRARQMAMMALYEAPLQMLSDSPTKYEKNMESFKFMAATPVVWEDTVGLGGCPDRYAAIARKAKDGSWYASGLTNSKGCEIEFATEFLGTGEWKAEIFRDKVEKNGWRSAESGEESGVRRAESGGKKSGGRSAESGVWSGYVHETKVVKAGEKFAVKMDKGGGFIVRFTK